MKTKTSNRLNILLSAITLLLIFVAMANSISQTHSWLEDDDEIGFVLNVATIDIEIKQGTRTITSGGYIYLGTDTIQANTEYLTEDNSVTITNNEIGSGYYIRFQAFAVVNGVTYNINQFISTKNTNSIDDFIMNNDGWMYSRDTDSTEAGYQPMISTENSIQTLHLISKLVFNQAFVDALQGQYLKLHLFVEGSATQYANQT